MSVVIEIFTTNEMNAVNENLHILFVIKVKKENFSTNVDMISFFFLRCFHYFNKDLKTFKRI